MPREIVTKGSRFYCVSLTPDICKTPIGSATPPIPYTVKGEFSEATGVSRNIRSNGEPVVISDSTVISQVTGDEAGTAKGIKSGTVGKRVQHDQKSSTVSFNGERAIREGDMVFMNDGNSRGKVLQRGGGSAPDTSFGDRFDAAMDQAATHIRRAQGALAGQVGRFAGTEPGGKVMAALGSVAEATRIKPLKDFVESRKTATMDAADSIGGRAIGIAASLAVAALEFVPTSAVELIPGGGKAVGIGTKAAKAAKGTGNAAKLEKAGVKAAPPAPGSATERSGTHGTFGSAPPA